MGAGGRKAGTTDADKVRQAMYGRTFKVAGRLHSTMDAKNHHLHKPVMIGEVKGDGQFTVVWKTAKPVRTAVGPFIAGNEGKPDKVVAGR